jgi:hypothetical protein
VETDGSFTVLHQGAGGGLFTLKYVRGEADSATG